MNSQGRRRRSGYGRTTFLPEMVLAEPHFWTNIFLQGHFLTFPSIPLLMTDFAMIKD